MGLCSECMEALPGEAGVPRLDLLRHTVTSQLSLLSSIHQSPHSRAAVEVMPVQSYCRTLTYNNLTDVLCIGSRADDCTIGELCDCSPETG